MSEVRDMENITTLPSGNLRVRVKFLGKVASKVFAADAYADAIKWREAVKLEIAEGEYIPASGASMKQLGPKYLASRAGNRDPDSDESRWHTHVATASWALRPGSAVTRLDGQNWLDELKDKPTSYDPAKHGERPEKTLSVSTRRKVLNLARCAFTWAIKRQLIETDVNPFAELVVEREDGDEDEGWQEEWYLDAKDQADVLALWDTVEDLDEHERLEKEIAACAITHGYRESEQWCLHLDDVHLDDPEEPHIKVRFGSWDPKKERYRGPKGKRGEKKPRKIPLWGPGLEAMKRWLAVRTKYLTSVSTKGTKVYESELVFPTRRGKRRDKKPPRSFAKIRDAYGVHRRFQRKLWWHLFRHTCATSLLAGWWGYTFKEARVQAIMGHADIRTTMRYAHMAPSVVAEDAKRAHVAYLASRGHAGVTPQRPAARSERNDSRARQDSNLRPTAPESQGNAPSAEWIARRDTAVTLIDSAWRSVDANEPTATRQCIAAMAIAREVLVGAIPSTRSSEVA